MDTKSEIVVHDSKNKKKLSQEYTEITLFLLKQVISQSGKSNVLTEKVVGVILNHLSKDTEWFIKLTSTFFLEMRQHILAKDYSFFASFDYKEQHIEWVAIFGESIANMIVDVVKNGIKKIMEDNVLSNDVFIYFIAILRKSAAYALLSRK